MKIWNNGISTKNTKVRKNDVENMALSDQRITMRNHIIFTQPLRSGRIWHKVNFSAEFDRFEFRVFFLLD